MPYLYPIWFCSVFLLIISTFKTRKRTIFQPYIWLVSFIICIYSYCCWKNFEQSKVIESTFSEPSTIIFISILSHIFLKTGISKLQISALFVITGGVIFPIFCSQGFSNINVIIVFKHILSNFLFSCVNMIYEIKIKPHSETIWDFLFTSSLFIFVFSSNFMIISQILQKKRTVEFFLNNTNFLLCVLETYSIIYSFIMVFQFLPVTRTLLKLFLSTLSGLFEGIFLIHSVKVFDVFSFLIISVGVVLYNMKEIKIFFTARINNKKKHSAIFDISQENNVISNDASFVYEHRLEDCPKILLDMVNTTDTEAIKSNSSHVNTESFRKTKPPGSNQSSDSQ